MDSRRAQNISIGIALFQRRGLSFKDIRTAICNFDDKVLTLDELLSLKQLLPTPEERALLEVYLNNKKNKSNHQFDNPELFLLELMKEPEIDYFMKSFIYKCQFKPETENLEKCFTQFLTLCENLKESDNLKILLKTVLALGNLTNHEYGNTIRNSYYASMNQNKKALGFKIEGLVKLRDVKSTDGKSNLLVFFFYFLFFYFYFILFFILFYFILFYFILFYFILFFILFYFILFYFILFYFILFYFILFYFILFYFILFFILFYLNHSHYFYLLLLHFLKKKKV